MTTNKLQCVGKRRNFLVAGMLATQATRWCTLTADEALSASLFSQPGAASDVKFLRGKLSQAPAGERR